MSVFGIILVRIFPAFSRIRSEYGEIRSISPYSLRMGKNVGKMRTRITPNTDTFYPVRLPHFYSLLFKKWMQLSSKFIKALSQHPKVFYTVRMKSIFMYKLFLPSTTQMFSQLQLTTAFFPYQQLIFNFY